MIESAASSIYGDAADPKALPYKVDIVRRMLVEINPAVRITSFVGNILHPNVLDELLRCDLLIGATDTFHGRAALSDFATHFLIPSVDVGVLMEGANGKVTTQLIELNRYHPDLPCAFCSGLIDSGALAEELMTEVEREARKKAAIEAVKRGDAADQYWKGRPRQLNTVGYLTTTAGALAAGYAEGWLTGAFKLPHDRFQFDVGQRRNGASANDPAPNRHTSDHLANERTFLAWIRTSISVIGLGFVVAKFTVWLRELSVRLDQPTPTRHSGLSMPLGIALMIFGAVLALTAAWRYRTVKTAILKDRPAAAEGTAIAVSVVVACIAVALTVYMLASA